MSYYFKNIKPAVDSETDEEEDLETLLRQRNQDDDDDDNHDSSDDELRTLSFGSLKKADAMMQNEEARNRSVRHKSAQNFEDSEDSEDSDSAFFEENTTQKRKKKNKHAPTEQSAKKPVSKIREIPGLRVGKNQNPNLYQDIRFDKSTGGHVDSNIIRRRYRFLDDYRENEIQEMETMLRDRKLLSKLSPNEIESIEKKLQSTKSRLETMKNRELEHKIVKEYQDNLNKNNANRFHLKRSERRKLVQKWKFEHMTSRQREKVMERKRKKRSGKEFKHLPFNK